MINKSQLISALTANHMYEQNMVYAIDEHGREQLITSFSDFCKVQKQNHSIKIERMENFNSTIYEYCWKIKTDWKHEQHVTCHLFFAMAGSYSFDMHTDPDDVVIYCCEGSKSLIIDDKPVTIIQGEYIHIPAYTPHQALNKDEALTLSFGLENYTEDKINNELADVSQNNRNMSA